MAWIKNNKTGVVTECKNTDVIKVCKKDTVGYIVSDDHISDVAETAESIERKKLSDMTVPELKKLAEEKGIEGYDGLIKPELLKVLGE